MRITFISDTHNLHRKLNLDSGDVLIHCGDVTTHGTKEELWKFLFWFQDQNYTHKLFIAGNHDKCLDTDERLDNIFYYPDITYMNHTSKIIDGVKFYGHPYTPIYGNMAFNKNNEELRIEHLKIPEDTDILITHGPPLGILDVNDKHELLGSQSLWERVVDVRPKIHAFGHIHESYGVFEGWGTRYINASNHTWLWKGLPYNPPISVTYEKGVVCGV